MSTQVDGSAVNAVKAMEATGDPISYDTSAMEDGATDVGGSQRFSATIVRVNVRKAPASLPFSSFAVIVTK